MRRLLLQTLGLSAFLVAGPALAQEPPAPPLPPGQTVLNISATEHSQIQQDILVASLRVEKQGSDAKTVQSQINALMQQALAKAKLVANVETSTEQYYVYPVDPDPSNPKTAKMPRMWRGTQSLQLKSGHSDMLLPLVGSLQELGLNMDNLSYMLSPEKEEAARDALMESALARLKGKAERAAKVLGKTQTDLTEVTVDASSNNPGPIRPMMAMAMAKTESMPAPSAEPGMTQIDLTVNAKAILKP